MLTGILIFLPLIAAFLVLPLKGRLSRNLALIAAVTEFIFSLYCILAFHGEGKEGLLLDYWWIKDFGISFKVGIDGINAVLVLLTTFLMPLIILSTRDRRLTENALFYALVLFMQSALIGVFTAMDAFLFYIYWELALIPIYFICLLWSGGERFKITFKFFIYTLSGSLLMLVAFIWLYFKAGSFDMDAFYQLKLSLKEQTWLFWALFIAFAIKIPIFPLHTWQPDTYTEAPAQGTMLLSGIMLKMGLYGIIRWLLPIVPEAVAAWDQWVIGLAITGVVYASCIAIIQKDLKRLVAYSSIAHVGLIAAGIFALKTSSLQGAMIQMLAHGVAVVGLFSVIEVIEERCGTRDMNAISGIRNHAPVLATVFMIIMLGSVALPLTSGFPGEFLILSGLFKWSAVAAAVGGLSVILGAVYMLNAYQKTMLGTSNLSSFAEVSGSDKWSSYIICLVVLLIGIFPDPVLNLSNGEVERLLNLINTKF